MDATAMLLKLLHVALALALTAGVDGRWIVLHRAAKSWELSQTVSLLGTAGEGGSVTHDLITAFADTRVRAARWAEMVGFGAIVALMVLKPF